MGWMKSEYYERNVDMRGGLLICIWNAAARMLQRDDQLRRTTRCLRTGAVECPAVDGEIFEYLLRTVTNLSFS